MIFSTWIWHDMSILGFHVKFYRVQMPTRRGINFMGTFSSSHCMSQPDIFCEWLMDKLQNDSDLPCSAGNTNSSKIGSQKVRPSSLASRSWPGQVENLRLQKKHNTSSNMSRLLLVIGPPCHGSVNVSWEDPSRFHRVPLGPLATDAWTSRTAIDSIGTCRSRNIRGFPKVGILKSDLQNYIDTSILGEILLSISPYFQPKPKKNSSSTEKMRWNQVIFSRVVRVVPTSSYGDVVVPIQRMVVSSGLMFYRCPMRNI